MYSRMGMSLGRLMMATRPSELYLYALLRARSMPMMSHVGDWPSADVRASSEVEGFHSRTCPG